MSTEEYLVLAKMTRAELADMNEDGIDKYMSVQDAALEIHKCKLKLLEELALEAIGDWMISEKLSAHLEAAIVEMNGGAPAASAPAASAPAASTPAASTPASDVSTWAPAQIRSAVVHCFRRDAEPIQDVIHATRKGVWSKIARLLQITKSDFATPDLKTGHRVVQQIFRWSGTIDVALLCHPHGRGHATHRRRRLGVYTEDGIRVCFAMQPPPAKVNEMLEKKWRAEGMFDYGEVILNVMPSLSPTGQDEITLNMRDMSGRRLAEHTWMPKVFEEGRKEGHLASLPPFVQWDEDGEWMMPAEKVESRSKFLEAKLGPLLGQTNNAGIDEDETALEWRERVRRAEITYRGPRCKTPRSDLPTGECECCSTVRWCTTCNRSKPLTCSECLSTPVLKCTACPRIGVRSKQSIMETLFHYAREDRFLPAPLACEKSHRALLEILCELEHEDRNDELLVEFEAPAREGESRRDRETRLSALQNHIDFWEWADGSPLSGKSYLARVFGFCFDHKKLQHSHACLQWCSEPRLTLIIPISDSLTNLAWVQGFVVDGWAVLTTPITLSDGTQITVRLRFLKGDAPMHQKHHGIGTGNSKFRCWLCESEVLAYTDLLECLANRPLRTVSSLDTIARRLACVPQCGQQINPRGMRVPQLRALARRLGANAEGKRSEVETRTIDALQGVKSKPAILGGRHMRELPVLKDVEGAPDLPLHVLKGNVHEVRDIIKETLPTVEKVREGGVRS